MKEEKVVVVTGASRGIGANIAEELALLGNKVILNYNKSKEQAEHIKERVLEQGAEIEIFGADISKGDEARKLIDFCVGKYGRIDVLINNAGISQIKLFTDLTDEDWGNMIQTNLTSCFYTTQEAARYMINQKEGCIINISSIWGTTGASCEVHYSAAKAGLDGMTKALAKELGPSNIRVNSIAPGIIKTEMNSELSEDDINNITQEIPLQRIGYPQSITNCVKWLINDDYTTGQVISVNGGWMI
ncbi:MAG: 3-oxoacyl-ACP reductase FabG [Clostridia bacterium]|nr:3-oxoacyl-ACP reductase FabG [Clostridia bacterium]